MKVETAPRMEPPCRYWHFYRWNQSTGGFLHSLILLLFCTEIWEPFLLQECHTEEEEINVIKAERLLIYIKIYVDILACFTKSIV